MKSVAIGNNIKQTQTKNGMEKCQRKEKFEADEICVRCYSCLLR